MQLLRIVVSFCCFFATVSLASGKGVYMHEYGNGVKRIALIDGDGAFERYLTGEGEWALYPDISSDGREMALVVGSSQTDLRIAVQSVQGGDRSVWSEKGFFLHPDFSGDQRFLAYAGQIRPGAKAEIAIIDLIAERARGAFTSVDGVKVYTPKTEIVPVEDPAYFPILSANGDFVVFQRSKLDGSKDIALWNRLTKTLRALTDPKGYSMAPALSADDQKIAYTAKKDDKWNIYVQELESGKVTQVTNTEDKEFSPTFRQNGDLVFSANFNGRFELYYISASSLEDGSFIVSPLVLGAGSHYAPSFSDDFDMRQGILKSIPSPARSSFGAIDHQGKIFIVGGHQGPEHTYPEESFLNRLDIYNQVSGEWSQGASLSLPRHGFGLIADKGYIYAFGGFAFSDQHKPKWKSVDLVERYDIAQNKWEVVGHLKFPRSSNVVAKVGTKVYLIGGWNSTPKSEDDYDGRFFDEIEVFDLETNTSSIIETKLNMKRRALSGVVKGNEIILVGGIGEGASHFDLMDKVTAFDTESLQWRELPKLPFATFAPAAGLLGNELFVFGGMHKLGPMEYDYVDSIYSINLEVDEAFKKLDIKLSEKKGFSQVVNLGAQSLGIIGGHTYQEEVDHPVATFETLRLNK